ncbi:MAG: hypothetical protein WBH10_01250 [Allopontixanthobacter sediminis]
MRIIPVIILATLAACAPVANDPLAPGSDPAVADGVIIAPAALTGEYRLAGVDGRDINLSHGISASISEHEIEVLSQCIRFKWTYALADGVLATERTPSMSCRRALLPEEEAISRAFDDAVQVRRTPANGIEFSGEGHTVTLFSQ